ncbi:MAG: hypothetical protein F3741_03425 [Nitrospinae bacterium]|nr:hypothetical protein [Nitrospinota bacterium]
MNDPFSGTTQHDPGIDKKKKLWRNLFLLNLCVSLLLIGIFWLPSKLEQVGDFLDSPSVNLPEEGTIAKKPEEKIEPAPKPTNLLSTQVTTINASSEKDYVYFDFSSGKPVRILDTSSLEWDLAFRRGKVISNGGASSKLGKAGLIDLGEVEFDGIAEVPLDNYIKDVAADTETENPVLEKWYNYNYFTHKLTAKKNSYAVRTADGKFAKFQFLSFYCDNKEAGCVKIRYVYQDNGSNSFLRKGGSLVATSSVPETNNTF